jgi:dGTPase
MRANDKALKAFLFRNMYRHYKVNRMASKAKRVVRQLFGLFLDEPETLPPDYQALCDGKSRHEMARVIADYIAGMTDRFALDEYRRLFDMQETP